MSYRERPTTVAGAVLWERAGGSAPERRRILPDGCVDLVWDGTRLFVAGPDSTARWHESPPAAAYVGLRLAGGLGPALLGVPAAELRDRTPDLGELWPPGPARELTGRVGPAPAAELVRWLGATAAVRTVDPIGPAVQAMAAAGVGVAAMADRLGLSARQLHRRCLPVFGYGPRRLSRVLRMGRAVATAAAGTALARVAAECGYADQAHLSREVRALTGTTPAGLVGELRRG